MDDRRILGGMLQWQQESMLGSLPMTNTTGIQVRVDDIEEVGLRRSAGRQILGDIRIDAVEESSAGLYWQNELHLSPQLRSVAGLRYDRFDFDVDVLSAGDLGTLQGNSGSESDDIVTASLSLIYALNPQNEIYVSIGQGFHSNDARGTTTNFDPVTADPILPVDPLVKTLGSEIGFRTFLTDRLNASVALWQLRIDSELLFVGDAGNTEDTGLSSEREGVELTSYFQINDQWSIDLEYAWTDAQFRNSGLDNDAIPGSLDNVFSGGVSLNVNDRLRAALRIRHFDDYPLDEGAEADSSTMVNLRLSYAFSPRFTVTADVLNLFDSDDHDIEYFYESQLPTETAPVADHHFHVFEPRSVRVYLEYRFL